MIDEYLRTFSLKVNNFSAHYEKPDFEELKRIFTEEENKYNFPPDGKIIFSEIEYFLPIYFKNKLVGFYKVVDLHFEDEIELHGSFSLSQTFLIRDYFSFTKEFVSKIQHDFRDRKISSMTSFQNKKVLKFLEYLGFMAVEKNEENEDNRYIKFILKK